MTSAELRTLLERVEEAGGPVKFIADGHRIQYVMANDHRRAQFYCDVPDETDLRERSDLISALERDLVERGYDPATSHQSGRWQAQVWLRQRLQTGSGGATKLEALLKAYLAVAEGWSA